MAQSGPCILVVDDEWDERRLIASVLREAGFDVVATAPQGSAAAAMNRQCFAAAVIALPGDERTPAPVHGQFAEFGSAAARLACLHNRRDAASAVGADRLVEDLTRQIGETSEMYREFAAPATFGHLSVVR